MQAGRHASNKAIPTFDIPLLSSPPHKMWWNRAGCYCRLLLKKHMFFFCLCTWLYIHLYIQQRRSGEESVDFLFSFGLVVVFQNLYKFFRCVLFLLNGFWNSLRNYNNCSVFHLYVYTEFKISSIGILYRTVHYSVYGFRIYIVFAHIEINIWLLYILMMGERCGIFHDIFFDLVVSACRDPDKPLLVLFRILENKSSFTFILCHYFSLSLSLYRYYHI